jgi:putative molybdopterin biosynthesis protein
MSALPGDDGTGAKSESAGQPARFMSVRQVAEYLHLNEKKVYSLVREGKIPATKITGKWIFPRELVDHWLLQSSHGGLLTDRLVVAGSDDPLLYHLVMELASDVQAQALVSYSPTGTRLGLALLAGLRADVGCVHWGPDTESAIRHPALLQKYPQHRDWVLVRAFRREQGLIVSPRTMEQHGSALTDLLRAPLAWAMRQEGAGTRRFLEEALSAHNVEAGSLQVTAQALSEREAAALVATGDADIAPGVRASASEFGQRFVPIGWEAFDFALGRRIYFRALFQRLLDALRSPAARKYADRLGGYDLSCVGNLIWGME